jgi:hypothetical protein
VALEQLNPAGSPAAASCCYLVQPLGGALPTAAPADLTYGWSARLSPTPSSLYRITSALARYGMISDVALYALSAVASVLFRR